MYEFTKKTICEGVSFGNIKDDRFKRGRINATLIVPLDKKTAAANALLSCVLTRSCRKYPDFTSLNRKLDELYGAALYPSVNRFGDFQTVTISVSGLDDRYSLDGKSISSEITELLCSILFEPNITDGHFLEEDFEQEKRQLLENIDAEFNDKRVYAINRCIETMCRDELFSVGRFGSREDVAALTQENIYKAWKNLLDNARVELCMLGSTPYEKAFDGFKKYFDGKPRKITGSTKVVSEVGEVKRIVETEEIVQSKLVMGFRCAYPSTLRERIANSLMSVILGGSPTSKLFQNVREKQSLCYYCASRADNNKGIMLIDSGVETDNIDRAESAVMEQLNAFVHGNVTDEELDSAKKALKNVYISTLDNLSAMYGWYIGGTLSSFLVSPAEEADIVDDITKDEVIELANKIKLDTVFSLIGN